MTNLTTVMHSCTISPLSTSPSQASIVGTTAYGLAIRSVGIGSSEALLNRCFGDGVFVGESGVVGEYVDGEIGGST